MNILILTTNPKLYAAKGELNATLAALTEGFARRQGHSVQVRNLAAIKAVGGWNIEEEIEHLHWADAIVYHFPIWWFGAPALLKEYFDEVLQHRKTFLITDIYGEGGQLGGKAFMLVVTSNMKASDLGACPVLANYQHIDDVLVQPILTNRYLGLREQWPTFHADNVIAGDTSHLEQNFIAHLQQVIPAATQAIK